MKTAIKIEVKLGGVVFLKKCDREGYTHLYHILKMKAHLKM